MDARDFDDEALNKLEAVGGNDLVVRMIELFTRLVPERLANGRAALASGDSKTLERLMHSMKSSAANVGAVQLQRFAAEAELLSTAPGDNTAALGLLLDELDARYVVFNALLEAEKARRS